MKFSRTREIENTQEGQTAKANNKYSAFAIRERSDFKHIPQA